MIDLHIEDKGRKMEVAAVSGMVGFCLGYLVCAFLIIGRDDDGE